MLTTCPECRLQVSSKAVSCPHCGFPFQNAFSKIAPRKNPRKHRRLPNGFGQITEIKGKYLRKPFRVMVTVGKDEFGKPICKLLKPEAYFETYNDAYAALVEYNRNPYDLDTAITVSELYDKWSEKHFATLKSNSSIRTVTSAWAYCSSLCSMRVKDVRARHIKAVIDEGYKVVDDKKISIPDTTKPRVKSLFNLMLDYAVEYELVDRNYARTFEVSSDVLEKIEESHKSHIPFTSEELDTLWKNINVPYVDILLVQCYSGWRPQELGLIKREDVDLVNWTFKGGMKTEAGKDRIVPIHSKIRSLVEQHYNEGNEYLFTNAGKKLSYEKYKRVFSSIRDTLKLNPDHKPHDGRMTFITACKNAGVDEYAIKYMVGHEINDVTEKVYTVRDESWLASEIEKIK